MKEFIVIITKATNVYRTKDYIVAQELEVQIDNVERNCIISHDVYFKRNKLRDKQFDYLFRFRKNINGRRLVSSMYNRRYVF